MEGHVGDGIGDAFEDEGFGFANGDAAYGEAIETVFFHGGEFDGAVFAEVGVFGALDDAEIELTFGAGLFEAGFGPGEGLGDAFGGVFRG